MNSIFDRETTYLIWARIFFISFQKNIKIYSRREGKQQISLKKNMVENFSFFLFRLLFRWRWRDVLSTDTNRHLDSSWSNISVSIDISPNLKKLQACVLSLIRCVNIFIIVAKKTRFRENCCYDCHLCKRSVRSTIVFAYVQSI